jgi:hypothetical protein
VTKLRRTDNATLKPSEDRCLSRSRGRQKSEDDHFGSHETRRCPREWCRDALCPLRISGRKTLKCRIAFTVSSDEDDCIELRESMIRSSEYAGNLRRSQVGTKIVS